MTEICERYACEDFNSGAFAVALIFAPCVIALSAFWIYLIPIFAVSMGYFPYLIFGGPVLLLYMFLLPHIPLVPTALLFGVNYMVFSGEAQLAQVLLGYGPADISLRLEFGSFFAPVWGIAFEIIYAVTRRLHPSGV